MAGDRIDGRPIVERHREGRADGEHVLARDPPRAQRREHRRASPSTCSSRISRPSPARKAEGVSRATIRPAVHDRHAVAKLLRLVQVVRREQDRHLAARSQAPDHVEQLVADARVEADGRLVEEQHLGPGDQRAGDLEPAALPAAVAADRPVEQLRRARAPRPARRRGDWPLPARRPRGERGCRGCARPVSARSTTGSWKTTLLARRAASGWSATSKPGEPSAPPGRGDRRGRASRSWSTCRRRWGRPGRTPRQGRPRKSIPFTASTPPG